jgi:hypothetical protein
MKQHKPLSFRFVIKDVSGVENPPGGGGFAAPPRKPPSLTVEPDNAFQVGKFSTALPIKRGDVMKIAPGDKLLVTGKIGSPGRNSMFIGTTPEGTMPETRLYVNDFTFTIEHKK